MDQLHHYHDAFHRRLREAAPAAMALPVSYDPTLSFSTVDNSNLVKRQSSSGAQSATTSCSDSGECEKPVGQNTMVLPIVLGAVYVPHPPSKLVLSNKTVVFPSPLQ